MGFMMTIKFVLARSGEFAMESGVEAVEDQGLTDALDGWQADLKGFMDGEVWPGRAFRAAIGFEQDAGMSLGAGGSFARGNERFQAGALLRCQANDIFLVHGVSWIPRACSDASRIPI